MWRASIPACSSDRKFFRDQYIWSVLGLRGVGVSSLSRL
jgi:hypothetical protein